MLISFSEGRPYVSEDATSRVLNTVLTGQKVLLDISFHSTKQERSENAVESSHHLCTRVLLLLTIGVSLMQEAVQVAVVRENLRTDEVEQREQLLEVVLQRCTGDKKATTGTEHPDDLRKDGVHVLDAVSLVDDDVLEGELLEGAFFAHADLVGGDAHFEA